MHSGSATQASNVLQQLRSSHLKQAFVSVEPLHCWSSTSLNGGGSPAGFGHDAQAFRLQEKSVRYNNALVVLDATGGGGGGKTDDDIVKIYRDTIPNSKSVFLPWQNKQEAKNTARLPRRLKNYWPQRNAANSPRNNS